MGFRIEPVGFNKSIRITVSTYYAVFIVEVVRRSDTEHAWRARGHAPSRARSAASAGAAPLPRQRGAARAGPCSPAPPPGEAQRALGTKAGVALCLRLAWGSSASPRGGKARIYCAPTVQAALTTQRHGGG